MSHADHEKLAQLKEQANGFTTKDLVLLLREDIKDLRDDYEPRIRSLERWKAAVPGVGVIGLALGVLGYLVN